MTLRAIIIDDDEVGIEALELLIEKFTEDVHVVASTSNPLEAVKLIQDYSPEIVFLDIQMPEMSGFDLLEKLYEKGFHLIFTTAHNEHALKALKLNAHDYLLKPVDYKELRLTVDRIRKQLTEMKLNSRLDYDILNLAAMQQKNKLAVTTKSGIESLEFTDIISFEAVSNYSRIYLRNKVILITPKTLKEFENQLCNKNLNFMRVHNSYLINLVKVVRYLKEEECIVLVNDQKIPIAKSRKDLFFKWLSVNTR